MRNPGEKGKDRRSRSGPSLRLPRANRRRIISLTTLFSPEDAPGGNALRRSLGAARPAVRGFRVSRYVFR